MQTVSAAMITAAGASVRYPVPKFEVQWDGVNWLDESANIAGFRLTQQMEIPGVELTPLGTTDAGSVTLRNREWRYSPWHSGGDDDIRDYIDGAWGYTGIKARLSMGFGLSNTAITVFADAAGGLVRATSAGHGLEIGNAVRIVNSQGYDGRYTVAAKTASTFDFAATWGSNTAQGWAQKLEFCRLFTGYLYNGSEAPRTKSITFALRDNAWLLYQKRASTALYANYRLDTLLYTLANAGGWDVVNDWTADTSPFIIPAAWLDDDALLQEMQQAAASVGGRLWCDANGDLRYEEASHWLGHATVLWHFDAGDLMDLPPVLAPENLASSVVVEYSPRVTGASRVLYTLDETRTVRPGTTETLDVRMSQPAVSVFPLNADTDYWFDNGAGLAMNSKMALAVTYYAQRLTITMTNSHATMPAVLRFLQIRGKPMEGGPQEEVEEIIDASPDVPRVRSVRGNFYLQSRQQARYVSKLLAGRHDSLIPLWHIRSAPGIPQLELGDRVGVYDARALSAEREGFVLSIEHRYTVPAGLATEPIYAQDIHVMDATPLFPSGAYFVIGTTALGSGVAWY